MRGPTKLVLGGGLMGIVNARSRFTKQMGHLLESGEKISCVLMVMPRGRTRSIIIGQLGELGAGAIQGIGGIIARVVVGAASAVGEPEGAAQTLASFFPNHDRAYIPATSKKPLLPNQIYFVITDRRYLGTCNNPGVFQARHHILVGYPPEAVDGIDLRMGGPLSRRATIRFVDGSTVSFDLPRGWTSAEEVAAAVRTLRARADA